MKTQEQTLLLFDIDGTLLHAEDSTRNAMNAAFRRRYGAAAATQGVAFFGRTDPELFQEAALGFLGRRLTDAEYAEMVATYLEILPDELARNKFYLMPGVAALLPRLAARKDVILGLETGNIEPSARLKLKRGGIDGYFTCGGFGSDSADRAALVRAAIERGRRLAGDAVKHIYVIGDAPHDIKAGKAAGARTVAVGTGRQDRGQLLAAGPDYFLEDLADGSAFLRCIGCES